MKQIIIKFSDKSGIIFNHTRITDNVKHIYLKINGWKIFRGRDDIYIFQDSFLEHLNKILYGFSILILLAIATNVLELSLFYASLSFTIGIICGCWCINWTHKITSVIELSLYLNQFKNTTVTPFLFYIFEQSILKNSIN